MGNRLSRVDSASGTTGYTVDAANRLTGTTGTGASTYTNDADGNTLTGGGRTSTWDSQNRMVSCIISGSSNTFKYGADGLRRQKTTNGTSTDYAYDGSMMIREGQATGGTLTASTVKTTYFQGASGPCYRRDDTQTETDGQGHTFGKTRWYVYDGLGSVVGELDPLGNLTSSPKYDVYGAVRANGGTASSKHGFVGSLGHLSEPETGLVYMRARYMDPNTGRFVSQDPSGNGNNWFVYCGDNPVNELDASGRSSDWLDLAIKVLWNLYGPDGVDLPDSPTEALDHIIQAAKNQIYAGRAAASDGAVDAATGDATQNDAKSAEGNMVAGAGLAQEAKASFALEQSEELQQFIVDMGDIIGP